jgi:hypothetical protein
MMEFISSLLPFFESISPQQLLPDVQETCNFVVEMNRRLFSALPEKMNAPMKFTSK